MSRPNEGPDGALDAWAKSPDGNRAAVRMQPARTLDRIALFSSPLMKVGSKGHGYTLAALL
jgi:hypothetical protein